MLVLGLFDFHGSVLSRFNCILSSQPSRGSSDKHRFVCHLAFMGGNALVKLEYHQLNIDDAHIGNATPHGG